MSSAALALSRLRLRLNRMFLGFQLVFDLALPVGYALLIGRTANPHEYLRLATGAFLLGATLSIMRLPAFVLMMERVFGTRDLLIAAGITRRDYIIANGFGGLYFAIFPFAAFAVTALALHVPFPSAFGYWAVLALYMVTLHGAGLIIASAFKTFGPFTLTINLVLLATATFCPVFYPPDRVPGLIRPLVEFLPASLAAGLALPGPLLDVPKLVVLCIWAIVCVSAGYMLLPWQRKR
jgi:ABC-type polysaccharide/polyol phosphate export permease